MIKVNVVVDSSKWKKKVKNIKKYFYVKQKKLNKIIKNKNQEFSILLTNQEKMRNLNLKFRKKNTTTDVLSFPNNYKIYKNNYIGDIAICFEIINKRSISKKFEQELDKMWIHGYLHLIGYNHIKNKDYQKMNKKEKLIFNKLNL